MKNDNVDLDAWKQFAKRSGNQELLGSINRLQRDIFNSWHDLTYTTHPEPRDVLFTEFVQLAKGHTHDDVLYALEAARQYFLELKDNT